MYKLIISDNMGRQIEDFEELSKREFATYREAYFYVIERFGSGIFSPLGLEIKEFCYCESRKIKSNIIRSQTFRFCASCGYKYKGKSLNYNKKRSD